MTGIWDLPDELVEEIMSWAPVASVISMKCVDKYWYRLLSGLIKSKTFVAKHLENFNSRSPSPLLLRSKAFDSYDRIYWDDALLRILDMNKHLEARFESLDSSYIRVKGSLIGWGPQCNGIICTRLQCKKEVKVALYNPALRDLKVISGSCYAEASSGYGHLVGFGHDPIANVYKVIRFVSLDPSDCYLEAEIHTLGVDGPDSWRKIELRSRQVDPEVYDIGLRDIDGEVYCNGFYYWSVRSSNMLLSFNMHDEKFQTISLSYPSDNRRGVVTKLGLWNNHSQPQIGMFRYVADGYLVKPIEMWVLHKVAQGDNKISYSWTKNLTTPPIRKHYHPLLFWNNGEELLLTCYANRKHIFASYNLRTEEVRNLQGITEDCRIRRGYFCVLPYLQSFVSFN